MKSISSFHGSNHDNILTGHGNGSQHLKDGVFYRTLWESFWSFMGIVAKTLQKCSPFNQVDRGKCPRKFLPIVPIKLMNDSYKVLE